MMSNENALSAYCFLSALTENQNDLYNQVYVPICKRALSLYSLNGHTHGQVSDIKALIFSEYGIDVPMSILQNLIRAVEKQMSKKDKTNADFKIFEKGKSFQIGHYVFSELEEQYKKSARDANAIQLAFQDYMKTEDVGLEIVPPFIEFLNKNKKNLALYFKGKPEANEGAIEVTYLPHVHFLERIATSNHYLYKIAESLYLGSIVASFLESGIDVDAKFTEGEIYYLDTPIVLRALDLQKEEETTPVLELFNLIQTTGGELRILSITVDEIQGIINKAIVNYDNKVPTSTINEACVRGLRKKSGLITLAAKIESTLYEQFKITTEQYSNSLAEKFKKNTDVEALKQLRYNKGSAIHDVLAYLYVREKRGNPIATFQKAKIWFLTSNNSLHAFNTMHPNNSGISEIATPEALTSILWLKNPNKNIDKVKSIGLSELMASTIVEEVASGDLINEFADQIQRIDHFSSDDYRILLGSVAHESAKNIVNFVELANRDPQKAKIEAQKLVERERSRRNRDQEKMKEFQKSETTIKHENSILSEQLNKIQSNLLQEKERINESQTQIEKLVLAVSEQTIFVKKQRILMYWILGSFLVCVLFGILFLLKNSIINLIPFSEEVYIWLCKSGGVFGFVSMLINTYKFFKGK